MGGGIDINDAGTESKSTQARRPAARGNKYRQWASRRSHCRRGGLFTAHVLVILIDTDMAVFTMVWLSWTWGGAPAVSVTIKFARSCDPEGLNPIWLSIC